MMCEECGREYKSAASLGSHLRRTHGIYVRGPRGPRAKKPAEASTAGHPLGLDLILQSEFPEGVPVEKIPAVIRWVEASLELTR